MTGANYPIVAREAWFLLASIIIVGFLVFQFAGWYYSIPVWVFTAFLLYLFRDPDRDVPSLPLAVISPVDGKVLTVDSLRDPFLDRDALRIRIRMSRLGVYGIRSPMEGKVMNRWYLVPGQEYPGTRTRNLQLQVATWIQSDESDDLVLSLGRGTQSPRCYIYEGERVGQGQRCGYIPLGSFVDIYMPSSSRITTQEGMKVRAGSDVIATLVHSRE